MISAILANLNRAVEAAVVRVVLEQVRHGWQVADVVEGDNFQRARVVVPNGLEHLAANAAETIDTNFDCHVEAPFPRMCRVHGSVATADRSAVRQRGV